MENTQEILRNLIEKAVVFPNNNKDILQYVARQFNSDNFSIEYVENPKNSSSHGMIIRTFMPEKPYLIYAGHLDVVPVDCEGDHAGKWCYAKEPVFLNSDHHWHCSAKNMVKKGDKIYGRGACDMLGSVAAMISSLKHIDINKLPYNFAVILADDEESQMLSSKNLLDKLYPQIKNDGIIGCIVGEPTEMQVLIGQRGSCRGSIEIFGAASHVARPDLGLDAFAEANKAYNYLLKQCQKERELHPVDARFIPDDIYCRILDIKTDATFKRTIGSVSLKFMINHLPTHDIGKILENTEKYVRILDNKLKQLNAQYGAEFNIQKKYPSFICEPNHIFAEKLGTLMQQSKFYGAGFSSDAPVFAQKGIPTVLLGPGSIMQAHEANEFIDKNQLAKAENFWKDLFTQDNERKNNLFLNIAKNKYSR